MARDRDFERGSSKGTPDDFSPPRGEAIRGERAGQERMTRGVLKKERGVRFLGRF